MGMSASQVRMLSLTSRLSDLEFSAQSVSNCKIRLADASAEASKNYQIALDKQKITVMNSDTSTYIDASAYNLTTYGAVSSMDKQRFLKDSSDRILVTEKVGNAYDESQNSGSQSYWLKNLVEHDGTVGFDNIQDFLMATLGYTSEDNVPDGTTYDAKQLTYYTNRFTGVEDFLNAMGYTSDPSQDSDDTDGDGLKNNSGATTYYTNVFNEIAENGFNSPGDDNMKDSEWLYEQLSTGNIFLSEWDSTAGKNGDGDFVEISWSSGDSSLVLKDDDVDMAKAEAEYNAVTAEIQTKDKRFDLQLKEIDTEHTAIQTEIDSVKKVIDKNIERTFKVFNG